jgi:carboxypeptidase Taq
MASLAQLKTIIAEVDDLENIYELLGWDQATYMPSGGNEGRAEQLATVQKLAHEKFTSAEVGRLLSDLTHAYADAPADDDDAAFVRVAARAYRRRTQIPTALVQELARTCSRAQEVWAKARADSNFAAFLPHLQKIFDLKRQVAACFPEAASAYDPLLDEFEPGGLAADVRALFDELKAAIVPLAQAIAARPPIHDELLRRDYDEARQLSVTGALLQTFGFDFNRGRQDRSVHPFCAAFGLNDVRVTTRTQRNYVVSCLMGSMHECGHGLYDQGYAPQYFRTMLGRGASLGLHESQSRLWENLVGRSRSFWDWYFPTFQAAFPDTLRATTAADFYRALNRVQPSFIRVEADEVTYNLHTLLRFEMEMDLLEGKLEAKDAPAAWNAKVKAYFGLEVPDDRRGILQDMHWASGLIAYFPTYTIGNILSVQLFEAAVRANPDIPAAIARGEFAPLLQWLRVNIHQHGRKYPPADLIQRATGSPMSAKPYIAYLQKKYGELYGL